MTLNQSCPLCGENTFSGKDKTSCNNLSCFIGGQVYQTKKFERLSSQIARIKQEAKQEVFDDIEKERIRIGSSDESNCFMKLYPHDWKEIKKKHGVE